MGSTSFLGRLVRRKVFTQDDMEATDLKRCLSTFDLVCLGTGTPMGAGIYIVAGQVAKETAGPAVVLSFLIAGIASAFAGICYAEFAARVPRAGSAYVYSYVTVGELMAFVIGWNLLLEYIIGSASVARGWSTYFDSLIHNSIQNFFREYMPMNIRGLSAYPDFFAFGITLLVTGILLIGVKESTRLTSIFTGVNLFVISFVVICGFFKANLSNWELSKDQLPHGGAGSGGFMPFGFSGMMSGAATCFYAYVGFDCVASTGEETKNPQKSIPIAVVTSLIVVSLAYCSIGAILTLVCPYFLIDIKAPLPFVFNYVGWGVAKYVITVGALCGMSTSLMGCMFPVPRILYAMGSDGLIFRFMARVNQRFKTPLIGTVVSGVFAGLMAMMFNLNELVNMMSIGTLLAYTLVALCVLILRYETDESLPKTDSQVLLPEPTSEQTGREPFRIWLLIRPLTSTPTRMTSLIVKASVAGMCFFLVAFSTAVTFLDTFLTEVRWYAIVAATLTGIMALACLIIIVCQPQSAATLNFKVPLVPYIPVISTFININLMLKLDAMTWLRFGVWMVVGFLIYFLYGMRQSSLNDNAKHTLLHSDKDTPCYSGLSHNAQQNRKSQQACENEIEESVH